MSCRSYRIGLQRGQSVLTFCAVKLDRAVSRGLTQIRPFEEMDTYEVLHRMRLTDANIPAVAFTAHGGRGYCERAVRAGFTDIVTKPVGDMDAFCRMIVKVANRRTS